MDKYQSVLLSYENAFRLIRREEKLSAEACVEELSKVLLLKLCFEHNCYMLLETMTSKLRENVDTADNIFTQLFDIYVPMRQFLGWEHVKVSSSTLIGVISELSGVKFDEKDDNTKGIAYSEFLQKHFTGYLSTYSTPATVGEYIFDVLGTSDINMLMDPCCGLGGLLVEAAKRKPQWMHYYGWDVSMSMAYIAKLHLMLYGVSVDDVKQMNVLSEDITEPHRHYDCIVSHIPFGNDEPEVISRIIDMLSLNGVAALIVSDALLLSDKRKNIRRHLANYAQILNITRFENVAYLGEKNGKSYNILFVKKTHYPSEEKVMATLIHSDADKKERTNVAECVGEWVASRSWNSSESSCKLFYLWEMKNWNVQLQFIYNEVGGSKYKMVMLGDVVQRVSRMVEIDADKVYTLLTVKSKGEGVEVRTTETGIDLKRKKMDSAIGGQLIISTLDVDKGAIGIVPKGLKNAVVSRNFMLFDIDESKIYPEYLWQVLCSKPVQRQLKNLNPRNYYMSRISYVSLSSVAIPLPSIEEQKEIVRPLVRTLELIKREKENLIKKQGDFENRVFEGKTVLSQS